MLDTCVLVADGHTAKAYLTDANLETLSPLQEWKNHEHVGAHGHRSTDKNDSGHHREEDRFAKSLAAELQKAAQQAKCSAVVLVAPAHFLGVLKAALPKPLTQLVTGTVSKDFGHTSPKELPGLIRSNLVAHDHRA